MVSNNRLVVLKQKECNLKIFIQSKLNYAGKLLDWGPLDPIVYNAVFIF